jgi:membrane associated rhomboid family serine protease
MFPLYDLNPHRRFPWMTLLLIAVNTVVMAWMASLGPDGANDAAVRYGFIPKRVTDLGNGRPVVVQIPQVDRRGREIAHAPKRIVQLPANPPAVYATLLTCMFLHGGWLHLVSNMWMLWIFGNNIEDRLGHLMYVCFYLVGGLLGSLAHWAVGPSSDLPVIGASGAVATVLGGYAVTYPWAKVRTLVFIGLVFVVDIPALAWLGIWFVLQNLVPGLLSLNGVIQEQVAFWAHIGGFVAGMILMPFMSLGASPPGTDWRQEAEEMFRFEDPRQNQR